MLRDDAVGSEFEVVIERKDENAAGVRSLVLVDEAGADLPAWEPGAHVDLVLGPDMVRQYSLCGDPADSSRMTIAVLRERDGRGGSAYVHDVLEEGDVVRLRGPRNRFPLVDSPRYLFIAGGIGITPIAGMVRRAEDNGADWTLLYGGRRRASMAFAAELAARYPHRVRVEPEDETGLLDLEAELSEPCPGTAVYCCGPEPLLAAVEQWCAGWPPGSLHVERFAPRAQDKTEDTEGDGSGFEVELARSARNLTVPPDRSVVEVLHEDGIDVPVSCQEGICGTCETRVLEGVPDHRDSILTEEERAENDTMFVCVSRCRSGRLRLDL